jgi:hypothetical protein
MLVATALLRRLAQKLHLLLLGDSNVALRASPKTAINEELAQVFNRHHIDPRRTDPHVGASACVKHPARQHDDHAGDGFDIAQPSTGSHLAVTQSKPPPESPQLRVHWLVKHAHLTSLSRVWFQRGSSGLTQRMERERSPNKRNTEFLKIYVSVSVTGK